MINGNLLVLLKISVGQINTILNKLKIDMKEEKCRNKIKLKDRNRKRDISVQLKIL